MTEIQIIILSFLFCTLFLFFIFRDINVGTDTKLYIKYFNSFTNHTEKVLSIQYTYFLFNKIIGFFTKNYEFLFLAYASVLFTFLFKSIKRLSPIPLISLLLYSLIYYCQDLNILRQGIITVIFFSSFPILIKSPLKLCIFICFLATIQHAALIYFLFFLIYLRDKPYFLKLLFVLWTLSIFIFITNKTLIVYIFPYLYQITSKLGMPNYFMSGILLLDINWSGYSVYLYNGISVLLWHNIQTISKHKIQYILFISFMIGQIISNLFIHIKSIERLSYFFMFSIIFIIPYLIRHSTHKRIYTTISLLLAFLYFYQKFILSHQGHIF